jgi:predicted Zn-dependent protease
MRRTLIARLTLAVVVVAAVLPARPGRAATAAPAQAPSAPSATPADTRPRVRVSEPELYEKSLQVAWHALAQYGVYDDPETLRRVNDIGYRVARESGFTDFPFTFHLADMPEPNAFALPAGHIFLTRGMLELDLDDDMLAALLGHEVAHVVETHYKEMKKKATLLNVLSQVLVAGVLIAAQDQERNPRTNPYDPRYDTAGQAGDLVQGTAAASLVVTELLLRRHSRENEAESDLQGQRWAAAAGFDPLGAAHLMERMGSRIPQTKKYGYWQTHPFFDERVRQARANGELIKRQEPSSPDDFRRQTQALLLRELADHPPELPEGMRPEDEDRRPPRRGRAPESYRAVADDDEPRLTLDRLVKDEALNAWPIGATAERLRLEKLEALRDRVLAETDLSRDFGRVIRAYKREADLVERLDPQSSFPERLVATADGFEKRKDDLYPKARDVLAEGIYETSFLVTFLSNYPDAPETPRAALSLGDAYSRLGHTGDAVRQYLRASEAAPESDAGRLAHRGLGVLTRRLEDLAALQQLALQPGDDALAELAETRLVKLSTSFGDIDNGAEYLRRFPDGPHAQQVLDRVHGLADELLAEMLLYQAVGDHVKAVERINKILNYAPTSEAAQRLRDRTVFES